MTGNLNKENKILPIGYLFVFPILFFYYELVFLFSTTGNFFSISTVIRLMFSCVYGVVIYLVVTIANHKKTTYILSCIMMGLAAFVYLVEYFVYRKFKMFYDMKTIGSGAGDAVSDYYREMIRLVFSWDGLAKILLYSVPVLFFALFCIGKVPRGSNLKRRGIAALICVITYFAGLLCVNIQPVYKNTYTNQFNYQSAVTYFGLLTGMRLDVKNMIAGDSGDQFEIPSDIELPPVSSVQTSNPEQKPKEYGYNQMDLKLSGGNNRIKDLNAYVSSLTASRKNQYTGIFKGKNLIMITAEAFTAEVIDKKLTPTLYRLSTKGINFTDYYQPASAGTTGGEYQNIFGMLPMSSGTSFKETARHLNYFTMGSQLDRLGYYGKAFHNNSYTYYDRNITHNNLGYSDGFMGYGNGMERFVKNSWPQSDLEMIKGTLPTYIDKEPFNVYYMSVSGHSDYSRNSNSMTAKNWEKVKDLPYSDPVKGYLAANLELEYAMEHLVTELEKKGIADDTVICISTDHFPYGLDNDARLGDMPYLSELYGYDVKDYFQRDHSRLILWCGSLEKQAPIVVKTPTSALDIVPTLSNLFGTEFDSRLFPGRDVFSNAEAIVFNTGYDWKTEYGTYYASANEFVPVDPKMKLPDEYVERTMTIVRNKIRYCKWVLETDYFRYLFG